VAATRHDDTSSNPISSPALPDDSERVPPLGAGEPRPPGRIESSYLPRSPLPEFVANFYLGVKAARKSLDHIFSAFSDAFGVSAADSPTRAQHPYFGPRPWGRVDP
jgi:hypothetical protein